MHEWEYNVEEKPRRIVNKLGEVSLDKPEPVQNLITWVYEQGSFVPCEKIVGNEAFSIVNDYIGRPILAFNEKGEKVWNVEYDIYGNLRNLQGNRDFVPFRQLGQYEDVETGLYYNRFRYYDCNTGTYISKDPISILGGLNVYAYVKDTNSYVDILGLDDLYALVAKQDGWYPIMEWGKSKPVGEIFLKQGELWKIGTSKDALTRYTKKYLNELNVEPKVLYTNISKKTTLLFESLKIRGYEAWKGFLPPGNKCRH